jgi:hypothetical protein
VEFLQWLFDALLGSPIPPPHWLDRRYSGTGWNAPGGIFAPRYRVPSGTIRAELEELFSCVNPPVIQGWAWCLALLGVASALRANWRLGTFGMGDLEGQLMLFLPIPLWFVGLWVGAYFSHDVELRDGNVSVRRWTDVWLGRPGRLVGRRETVHAVLSCGHHLQLEGDAAAIQVSMAMWPRSSRQALEDRLEHWEVELEYPGRHHVRHPAHWNHGRHRVGHRIAVSRRRSD